MSSKIKVDTIENVAGSGNVSLGSGHNLVVPGTVSVTGNLTVDTNTLHVDSSNNKVGIGTTSPAETLEVVHATAPAIQLNRTNDGGFKSIIRQQGNDFEIRGSSGSTKIYTGNADGDSSTARLLINASGHVTKPSQPSFAVYGVNNNTGFNMIDGTTVKLANWSNAYHNTGSHFNTTTGVFTAPVTGKYFFYLQVMFRMNTSSYINDFILSIKKNGAQIITTDIGYNDDGNGDGWNTETLSSIISLNANDTVDTHYFLQSSSHSTGAATSWYLYNGVYTQFHGHLLG